MFQIRMQIDTRLTSSGDDLVDFVAEEAETKRCGTIDVEANPHYLRLMTISPNLKEVVVERRSADT